MHHKEQPSCSTQIDDDYLGGQYCTLKHEYAPTGMTGKPNTQRSPQAAYPSSPKPAENNNIRSSPKQKVSRSISSPEQQTRRQENDPSKKQPGQANGVQRNSGLSVIAPGRRSTGHVKVGGRRSTGSLSGREPPPPLRYFAYLGRLNTTPKNPPRPRSRLPSAHDILADRPVILTSTSIVSPYATNVICQEIEELEREERQAEYNDLLDCCTCMCCVKALFYHCTKDSKDEGQLAEHPCSCKGPVSECVGRWGIMGLISIFLPCLLCYLPFEACFRCHDCMTREKKTETSKYEEPSTVSIDSRSEMVI